MNLHDLLRFLELSDLGRHAAATVKAPELPTITPEACCTDPDLPAFLDVFSKCGQASYIKLHQVTSSYKVWTHVVKPGDHTLCLHVPSRNPAGGH